MFDPMLTPYACRLLARNAAALPVMEDADGWKPISGSGMRKPAVRLAFAPRKSGAVWIVRVRGRQVFESPDKTAAISHRDALLTGVTALT